jgi:nucleoside-diphosphate-sugar epimerase
MRIFLTGATGFIGSALVPELLNAGHEVIGMTRSQDGAEKLIAAGVEPHLATLEDVESIERGARKADAVIHTAFDHNFERFAENCEMDGRGIEALGAALAGSDRPLLITSGIGMGARGHGQAAVEDAFDANHPNPRIASERAGNRLLDAGINVSVIRLPQVHNTRKQGLISPLLDIAKARGVSAYVGAGTNQWSAGHLGDVARLFRLAIEKAEPGARYHAVGEEGVEMRLIAEALGRGLNVPVVSISADTASEHFGVMGRFVGLDMRASSAQTQAKMGWHPTGPTLISDLDAMIY